VFIVSEMTSAEELGLSTVLLTRNWGTTHKDVDEDCQAKDQDKDLDVKDKNHDQALWSKTRTRTWT